MMSSTRRRWATSSFWAMPQYTKDESTPDFIRTWRPSIRLSSTVIPRKSAMFWKVRATPSSATWLGLTWVMSADSSMMRPVSGW